MAISQLYTTKSIAKNPSVMPIGFWGMGGPSGTTYVLTVTSASVNPVASVVDDLNSYWTSVGRATNGYYSTEIWYARGVPGDYSLSASVSFETAPFAASVTTSGSVAATLSQYDGIWYADPLDQWSFTNGNSASPSVPTLTQRDYYAGELIVGAIAGPYFVTTSNLISLSANDVVGLSAGYFVYNASGDIPLSWVASAQEDYAAMAMTMVSGRDGINPKLQFPETLVEICTDNNYLGPLQGSARWTNITSYVRSMGLGPSGRQHELDRVQATQASITVDNRSGIFNPWNSDSFLYNNGHGLKSMNPIRVTAAWKGVTYPAFYGYAQDFKPAIQDVLNADLTISAVDIFQMFSLKYLSNNNYAQQVLSQLPAAFYRLNEPVGSRNVIDSSGNGFNMTLVNGPEGFPLYGAPGSLLYDASTGLDLTNGSNFTNSGITNIDNTGNSPVTVDPLNTYEWSFEAWIQWKGDASGQISEGFQFTASVDPYVTGNTYTFITTNNAAQNIGSEALITGFANPVNVVIASDNFPSSGLTTYQVDGPIDFGGSTTIELTSYVNNFTLFSARNGSNQPFDIRVGSFSDFEFIFGSIFPNPTITYKGRLAMGATGTIALDNNVIFPDAISRNSHLLDGYWHHVVVSYSPDTIDLYIDGGLDSTWDVTTSSGFNYSYPTSISLGANINYISPMARPLPGVPSQGFVGYMQDIALYSPSLTESYVADNYAVGTWFQSVETGAAAGGVTAGRLNKVVTVMGLDPTTVLNVPIPFVTELYAESAPVATTSALTYLQTIGETEPGVIFQGPDGLLYAYNRQYQYFNPTSTTSQATYGDNPYTVNHYEGPSLQIASDDLDVWNDVQVQSSRPLNTQTGTTPGVLQEWGPIQSPAASVSLAYYGPRTLQGLTSLQQQNDIDALSLAQNYLAWYATPIQRVAQLEQTSATSGGANIPKMLGLGIMDRITVQYQGQTPGPQFEQDCLIEQITHTITIEGGPLWQTSWALSPYEILMSPIIPGTPSATFSAASVTPGQLTL